MAEFFRQFAFVSSVLGGFSLAFFGTLLGSPRDHRVVGPAAALALGASACFLIVTLSSTFTAAVASDPALVTRTALGQTITARLGPLSLLFLVGVLVLLASFGAAGWIRSRALGLATTGIAVLGLCGAIWALRPFMSLR